MPKKPAKKKSPTSSLQQPVHSPVLKWTRRALLVAALGGITAAGVHFSQKPKEPLPSRQPELFSPEPSKKQPASSPRKLPRLSVHFAFATHVDKHDAEHFLKAMRETKADIVVTEAHGGDPTGMLTQAVKKEFEAIKQMTPTEKKRWNETKKALFSSSGDPSAEMQMHLQEGITNAGLPMMLGENPGFAEARRLEQMLAINVEGMEKSQTNFIEGNFLGAVKAQKDASQALLEMNKIREETFVRELKSGAFKQRLFDTYPHLLEKPRVNALLLFGHDHSHVADQSPYPGFAFYQTKPVFDLVEAPRKLAPQGHSLSQHAPMTDLSAARTVFGRVIETAAVITGSPRPRHLIHAYSNTVANQYSNQQIRELSEAKLTARKLDIALKKRDIPTVTSPTAEIKSYVVRTLRKQYIHASLSPWKRKLTPKK